MKKYLLITSLSLLLLVPLADVQDNLIQLKAVIHISSEVSEGRYTLEEIAKIAKDEGISVVIFTDRDLMRWEYGLWPLRNISKKRVEKRSIFRYGIKRYLEEIKELNDKFPEMIFIPGTESAPYYYWGGSPFKGNLKMYNWHQHILTIGLENYEDYRDLPVIGNPKGLRDKFNILKLWPFLTLIFGLWYFKKGTYKYTDYKGEHLGVYSKKRQASCVAIVLLSLTFILNNWPFFSFKFDQYHNDLGKMPYQNFIDYVSEKRGLTFWAHPEAEYILRTGNVYFETREHTHLLLEAENYTGFSIFYEGYKKVGKPGEIWDRILKEYCQGLRERPIWAIGGLASERGSLSERIKVLQNIVLVSEKSKKAVLDALRKGKIYVTIGGNSLNFKLSEFSLSDEVGWVKGFVGDTVRIEGKPVLHIEGSFLEKQQEVEVRIIKEGEIVKTYKTETPFALTYYEDGALEGKSYYRLEIKGKGLHLVTNPIFAYYKK